MWMILMTKMMTWRKYDTALSSAAAAGAELNGHLLTWAFLPVIVTVVMMVMAMRWLAIMIEIDGVDSGQYVTDFDKEL